MPSILEQAKEVRDGVHQLRVSLAGTDGEKAISIGRPKAETNEVSYLLEDLGATLSDCAEDIVVLDRAISSIKDRLGVTSIRPDRV